MEADSLLKILDKCTCNKDCPLRKQCNLNQAVYEEDICSVLRKQKVTV